MTIRRTMPGTNGRWLYDAITQLQGLWEDCPFKTSDMNDKDTYELSDLIDQIVEETPWDELKDKSYEERGTERFIKMARENKDQIISIAHDPNVTSDELLEEIESWPNSIVTGEYVHKEFLSLQSECYPYETKD